LPQLEQLYPPLLAVTVAVEVALAEVAPAVAEVVVPVKCL
jgi:hypothetical protein